MPFRQLGFRIDPAIRGWADVWCSDEEPGQKSERGTGEAHGGVVGERRARDTGATQPGASDFRWNDLVELVQLSLTPQRGRRNSKHSCSFLEGLRI